MSDKIKRGKKRGRRDVQRGVATMLEGNKKTRDGGPAQKPPPPGSPERRAYVDDLYNTILGEGPTTRN